MKTQTNNSQSYDAYFDQARIQIIQEGLCLDIENLFCALDVKMNKYGKRYQGCCPIHSGDRNNAIVLYPFGDSSPGYWRCYTKHCEKTFKPTIIGFVRGVLAQKKGWKLAGEGAKPNNLLVSYAETVDWCCEFLKIKLMALKPDNSEVEKRKFNSLCSSMYKKFSTEHRNITRAQITSRLEIPSPYFVKRGFSPQILTQYDVGYCNNEASPFYGRSVVPVYEQTGNFIVGFTGRSSYNECELCGVFHNPSLNCPSLNDRNSPKYCKWLNDNFERDSVLYSYNFAQKQIRETGKVILVEGPGDVWKFAQAGINNAVAMLGWPLTDRQQILLETSGAMCVIIATDNDEAGQEAAKEIANQLKRSYKTHRLEFPSKDIGELEVQKVKELIHEYV